MLLLLTKHTLSIEICSCDCEGQRSFSKCYKMIVLLLNNYLHLVTYEHGVSEKSKQNYFCYNYVKLLPNPTIFGTKMANCLKLYEVH